jgi:hypothetical protein
VPVDDVRAVSQPIDDRSREARVGEHLPPLAERQVAGSHAPSRRSLSDRAYAFADWCRRQGGEPERTADVAFYRHSFDAWDVHADVMRRLDGTVTRSRWPLWQRRLDPDQLTVLGRHLPT